MRCWSHSASSVYWTRDIRDGRAGSEPEILRSCGSVSPKTASLASHGNGWMVAFTAPSRAAVDTAYAAAIACGGTDEGPPGLRLKYAADYYGAYVRDPEGNKLHFVTRGD